MVRPILKLGTPALHCPAAAVADFGGQTQQIIDDMIETMHAAPGIGLAAPQVGEALRLFVVDLSVGHKASDLQIFINPEIVERDGMQLEEEGCLSVPGFVATVLRPSRMVVRAADRDGSLRTVEGTGLLARALQHEMDHLDGLLYVHRLRGLQRASIERGVRKLEHLGRW
ncbi:MAG: peptide deformylase [Vicinamibacteria bacterium]|nr:peptide deformylase [Vicinamibacteria bacterium]